jgi:hypothetical protein
MTVRRLRASSGMAGAATADPRSLTGCKHVDSMMSQMVVNKLSPSAVLSELLLCKGNARESSRSPR